MAGGGERPGGGKRGGRDGPAPRKERGGRIPFAREGSPFILGAGGAALALWGVGLGAGSLLWTGAGGLFTVLTAFLLYFFRDPRRTPPEDPALVVSAGEGTVVEVTEDVEEEFMEGPCRRVSVFLSVFNVHVQRAPLSGTVTHRGYRPGGYAVAWKPEASRKNEQASLGLAGEGRRRPVLMRQIAGLVARRIVTDPEEGDEVLRGERVGIILFGSRVDLFFPLEWTVLCREGDRVRAGETPVARVTGGRGPGENGNGEEREEPVPAGAGAGAGSEPGGSP